MTAHVASYAQSEVTQVGSQVFTFGVNTDDVARVKRALGKELSDRVSPTLAKAISATAAMLRKEVSRIYASETGIKPGVAYSRLWLNRPRVAHKLKASVRLGAFGLRYDPQLSEQTPLGVNASVGRRSVFLKSAFIRALSTGHEGVFRRENDVKIKSRDYRQGIREVRDESATSVMERTGQVEPLRKKAADFLSARISTEIDKLFVGARA